MDSVAPSASDTVGSGQPFYNDAVAGAAVQIKGSRGQLYALKVINTTAAAAYLQIFFKPAAQVVLGTTVPDAVVPLAASENFSSTFPVPVGGGAVPGTGLSVAGTTTPGGATGAALKVMAIYQ